jgi:hypothetical protein
MGSYTLKDKLQLTANRHTTRTAGNINGNTYEKDFKVSKI